MRRLLVILLVSWVYAGCATAPPQPETTPDTSSGGRLRLLPSSPGQAEAIRDVLTAGRLAPDGLLKPPQSAGENCVSLGLATRAEYPDGHPAEAASVIAEWEALLRRDDEPAAWLLAAVAALEVDPQNDLRICTETPTPDWPARLAHPGLWLRGMDAAGQRSKGPGSFQTGDTSGLLVASSSVGKLRPILDEIEILEPGSSDPALLFELDAVDLALVSGRAAAGLVDDPDPTLRVERLEQWDTVYALWFGARGRWVSDPRFRAWIAGAVDRESMLRLLFDGRGEPAFRLTAGGAPEWTEPPTRPFSRGSVPRLDLIFDSADAVSTSIAARLKAVLEQEGLSILLEPVDGDRLREATIEDGFQMALVAHHPPVSDPVLALQHTLWSLGDPTVEAWNSLVRASWWDEDERRRSAALSAEDTLLRQARLVPLIRVHLWLVSRPGLEDFTTGAWSVLRLDRARWTR